MKRILRIDGQDYETPAFIHRRFASNAWSITLPGLDMNFSDIMHGGTAPALQAAKDSLPWALSLPKDELAPHCTLTVGVRLRGIRHEAYCKFPHTNKARVREVVCVVKDETLAKAYYDYDLTLPLLTGDAVKLVGEEAHTELVNQWYADMRDHITATSIARTRLEHAPRMDPVVASRVVPRVKRHTQRSLW